MRSLRRGRQPGPGTGGSSRSAVDRVLERFAGLEARHVGRRDLDRRARLRVAALATGPVLDREGTEADQGNLIAFLQGLGDVVDDGVERTTRVGLVDVGVGRDCVDEFGFVHCNPLW